MAYNGSIITLFAAENSLTVGTCSDRRLSVLCTDIYYTKCHFYG